MAAPVVHSADDLLQTINGCIENLLERHKVPVRGIKVGKRNNDFSKGDLFLSRGCVDTTEQVISAVHDGLVEELTNRSCHIKTVSQDKYSCIVIHLNREKYFKNTVSSVITGKGNYGVAQQMDKEITIVNENLQVQGNAGGQTTDDDSTSSQMTLDTMRSLVLEEHTAHLLKTNGYTVTNVLPESRADTVLTSCNQLGIDPCMYTTTAISGEDTDSALKLLDGQTYTHRQNKADISEDLPGCGSMDFDLKNFIEEKRLHVGKDGFDKNLTNCCVQENAKPSCVFQQALTVHKCLQCKNSQMLLHLEGQSWSFTSQKVDLLLKALAGPGTLKQKHFVHGSVTKAKGSEGVEDFNSEAYLQLRYNQMKDAAVMKYGNAVQGKGWEDTLRVLTLACVKFELLSNQARNTVKLKLDMSGDKSVENSLQGSFVMYNCARLATLFTHFEDGVRNGSYPPLPPVETIDYSTLREEEEWGLLFNYVYPYPDLVKETVKGVNADQSIVISLHTHKICQMLIGLSRSVSVYYSRYHVLGESRPHLLPIMYARLYLLKAVHQVMVNSLGLLGITPVSQL